MPSAPIDEFIALDCETTGLDAKKADIIEVALYKFKDGKPVENIIHFVKPGHPIPLRNRRLTGIDDTMVQDAPSFGDIAESIQEFIVGLPLVGHNISFDLRFLNQAMRKNGFDQIGNAAYDTLRLAALFFPEEPSLKLTSLADKFNVLSDKQSHRAGADAELSGELFIKLQEYIRSLPDEFINFLSGFGPADDGGVFQFLNLLKNTVETDKSTYSTDILKEILNVDSKPVSFPPGEDIAGDDLVEATRQAFEAGGRLEGLIENFAHRAGQPEMAVTFAEHLMNGGINAVEAGCGMGKSPAYLVPSVMAAGKGRKPIVISTYTKNLQDQLAGKDLPALAPLHPGGLSFTTLKGRANYICLSRLVDPSGKLFGADRLSAFERALLLSWVHCTREGDIDKLNFFILNNFNNLKSHLNFLRAEGEFCQLSNCRWQDHCFVLASRKRASASDIVITNHSLFFAGFEPKKEGMSVLPDFKHVIFDEAHHLEDSIAASLSLTFDSYIATRLIKRLIDLLAQPDFNDLDQFAVGELSSRLNSFIGNIGALADIGAMSVRKLKTNEHERYAPRVTITPEICEKPDWMNICSEAVSFLQAAEQCGKDIEKTASESGSRLITVRLNSFAMIFSAFCETIRRCMQPDFKSDAVWLDTPPASRGNRLRINVWPLSAASHFRGMVESFDSCQFTSATLSAFGDIGFFTSRLGLEDHDVDFSSYPAPFDLPIQMQMYIPTDIDPPTAPDQRIWQGMRNSYIEHTAAALKKIILRFQGHTLALFTSVQDMDDIGEAIRPDLEAAGISCLLQFRDGGKSALIDEFSNDPRTALIGTRSFFEGVDIPNKALKCLVIARLPFPHPEEPLHFSRTRKMTENGEDWFSGLSLPMANLSLRQAVGRLIRTPYDEGVVFFLDNRLITKGYGEALLSGMDGIPREAGPLDEIIEKAAKFVKL